MHVYGKLESWMFGYADFASLTLNRQAFLAAALNAAGVPVPLGALLSMNPTFSSKEIISSFDFNLHTYVEI
jgi:hypothetical protein